MYKKIKNSSLIGIFSLGIASNLGLAGNVCQNVLEEMEQCIAPEVVGTFSFSFVINEFVSRL